MYTCIHVFEHSPAAQNYGVVKVVAHRQCIGTIRIQQARAVTVSKVELTHLV